MPVYRIVGKIYGFRVSEYVIADDQKAAEQCVLNDLKELDRAATVDPKQTKLIHPVEEPTK